MERTVVLQTGVGLQILSQLPGGLFVIEPLVEIPAEVHLLRHIKAVAPDDSGIVGGLSPSLQLQQYPQGILRVLLNQVLQRQAAVYPISRRLIVRDLRVLDQPGAVRAPDLDGDSCHARPKGIHREPRVPALAQHSHRISLEGYVHVRGVAVELVVLPPVHHQRHQR